MSYEYYYYLPEVAIGWWRLTWLQLCAGLRKLPVMSLGHCPVGLWLVSSSEFSRLLTFLFNALISSFIFWSKWDIQQYIPINMSSHAHEPWKVTKPTALSDVEDNRLQISFYFLIWMRNMPFFIACPDLTRHLFTTANLCKKPKLTALSDVVDNGLQISRLYCHTAALTSWSFTKFNVNTQHC